jgi:hypothetical protein
MLNMATGGANDVAAKMIGYETFFESELGGETSPSWRFTITAIQSSLNLGEGSARELQNISARPINPARLQKGVRQT